MMPPDLQVRYYVRIITFLMQKLGLQELKVHTYKLDRLPECGTYYDKDKKTLLIALGDAPKPSPQEQD